MLSLLLIIGIFGYFTVPGVANYIVNAGGGNAMLSKINSLVVSGSQMTGEQVHKGNNMQQDAFGDMARKMSGGISSSESSDYFKDKVSGK